MSISLDEGGGQKVGSRIRLSGKAFGLSLFLDEAVIQRDPPRAKAWETVGDLKLLVIGHYRMGFEVEPQGNRSRFRVFIDYDLPLKNTWLGRLFGDMYARWCVRQMVKDTQDHFTGRREK